MASTSIHWSVDAGLATVTLRQPERGNPIDGIFTREFRDAMSALWDTPGLRAVLLRADGPNFSVGGDLKSFVARPEELGSVVRAWTADLHMGLQRAWSLPVPVIAAVQGFAMGGGLALAAGCDFVVGGESSSYGSAFAKIGFSCDSGTTVVLSQRMGLARAKRFVLTSDILKAQDALAAGLIDKVVPDAKVQDEALQLARTFAAGPTVAYGQIKRLFAKAGATPLAAQLEDEAITLSQVSMSADAREGVASLVGKRKPEFRGV